MSESESSSADGYSIDANTDANGHLESDLLLTADVAPVTKQISISEAYYKHVYAPPRTHARIRADAAAGGRRTVACKKEKADRVETQTWQVSDDDLTHAAQLEAMHRILAAEVGKTCPGPVTGTKNGNNQLLSRLRSHVVEKLANYRHQDQIKHGWAPDLFATLPFAVQLLVQCGLTCHYCSAHVYVLYKKVLESKQWTLDRIDNTRGHNRDNVVVACLECNLKRRRTNKEAFLFTKTKAMSVRKLAAAAEDDVEDTEDGTMALFHIED